MFNLQELILSHLGTAGWGSVDYVNLDEIVEEQESKIFIEALQRWAGGRKLGMSGC